MQKIIAKSTGGLFPHTHTLELDRGLLVNPPSSGVTVEVSAEYSLIFKHKHSVHFTQSELLALAKGAAVTVKDTDKGRHSFTLQG